MPSAERIRELLPSLWRPEPEAREGELLAQFVATAGSLVDAASIAASEVMQAHWFRYSDSALVSPYVARFRSKQSKAPLVPGDPSIDLHPYLDDLARLAGLLGVVPWREPLDQRETVEEFRRRIERTVALYRDGLGTRSALRRMTLASLPAADRSAAEGLRERGFSVEEAAPVAMRETLAPPRGIPGDVVGPLMRWRIESGAVAPTPAEVYIEGVEAVPGEIDATERPIIERFDPTTGTGIGIAYDGTIAAGQTLAIVPAFVSWLGGDPGLMTARHEPSDARPADPTAAGPWNAAADAPDGSIRAFALAPDGALWAAANSGGEGALWRLAEAGWVKVVSPLPQLNCLLTVGRDLLIGHANGFSRMPAAGADPIPLPDPAAATDPAVLAIAADSTGRIWLARAIGAAFLGSSDTVTPVGPGERTETETELNAILAERDGYVLFGGALGLFLHDPARDLWHVYRGGSADETVPDWIPWNPDSEALPDEGDVFLPEVTSLLRSADQTLWIGTARGLAAYRARARLRTYATLLEAFPSLTASRVETLAEDARQRLWAGTAQGLFTFDGLDWRRSQGGSLKRLPRNEPDPLAFIHWRFHRASGAWQTQERGSAGGFTATDLAPIATDEPPVLAIAWTDAAIARIGTMADGVFTADPSATIGALGMRYKPDAIRILAGGIPAMPRLVPGASDWRYLAIEEETPPEPTAFPAWTREGRLLPPPDSAAAPEEGRYLTAEESALLASVYSFNPAARVTFRWRPRAPLSVIVRLERKSVDESIAPAIIDRLWEGLNRVRPAGARVAVAVGEDIVRGGGDG